MTGQEIKKQGASFCVKQKIKHPNVMSLNLTHALLLQKFFIVRSLCYQLWLQRMLHFRSSGTSTSTPASAGTFQKAALKLPP